MIQANLEWKTVKKILGQKSNYGKTMWNFSNWLTKMWYRWTSKFTKTTQSDLINKILVFEGFFLCSLNWGSLCGFRDCNGKEGENNLLQNWTVEQTTFQKSSSLLLFLKKTTCDFFQIWEQKGLKIMDLFASLYLEGICKDKRLNADLKLKSSCIHN